ncbi:hypothetical protein [Actinomyces sp. oral taxon 175]|uniref:hypothetical protein n=1 Tax=Actinomyces sp. oral taxon 175 TaxID=712119 RepID=UPI00021D3C20|nr:hypothetical protein [Actinomyces sp. oral taxon 175]EGV11540.1 hypothetical protein HMPREF9058_0478 [Actinomyces sp. oral taxon 175 str. F0384]
MSQYPGSQYPASPAGWSANGYDPALAGAQSSQYPPAAPFQTPQGGYSGAASQPATSKSLAAPTALAVAGLAILLIAIIGGIGSAVTRGQFNATVTNLPDDQAATVELDKGSTYGLFYSDGDDAPECSVTSPDGDDVDTKSSSSSTKVKGGKLFSTFSSKKSGAYTVDCNSTAGVSVGEIIAPSSATATLLSLFGAVGAIIMAVVGLAMGAGGMAWRSKLAAAGTAPAAAGEAFSTTAGATPGTPTVYTQGAWQSDQQPQAAQYAQQPQYQQPEPAPSRPLTRLRLRGREPSPSTRRWPRPPSSGGRVSNRLSNLRSRLSPHSPRCSPSPCSRGSSRLSPGSRARTSSPAAGRPSSPPLATHGCPHRDNR